MKLTAEMIQRFELVQRTEGTEKAIEDLLYNMLRDE
jgi:hypothetical protein